jgi:phosphohistidine swiveling domain-containing protein
MKIVLLGCHNWKLTLKASKSTKAGRLSELRTLGFGKYLLPQFLIHKETLKEDLREFDSAFAKNFKKFAVRSSSSDEDQKLSNAGKYVSLLDVSPQDIEMACNKVLASYSSEELFGEVLVQPMLERVKMSGVLFTFDPSTGSPYKVINLNFSSSTDIITSGSENGHLIVLGNYGPIETESYLKSTLDELLEVTAQISALFENIPLDFEFAISDSNQLTILQVRPLQVKRQTLESNRFEKELSVCQQMVRKVLVRHPSLFGEETFLSVMSDWNPAELIGVRPTQLSITLFKELISDNIWAYERSNFGYKNMRSFPLMIELAGQPYIDLRVSFNSLIPNSIKKETSQELAAYYLREFKDNPEKHDKVEFELYFSSYTASTRQRISKTDMSQISQDDLVSALIELTSRIIKSNPYGISQCISKSAPLENKLFEIRDSQLPALAKIYWLIEDCKRYGTLPFSGIARCAFIATEILRSFVTVGAITQNDLDCFLKSIESLPSKLGKDSRILGKNSFLEKYGHLRPGTFDIRNLTYSENYDLYFKKNLALEEGLQETADESDFIDKIEQSLSIFLAELDVTAKELVSFCILAIRERENTKFRFSRHISLILDLIVEVGDNLSISRSDLAHLDIKQLLKLHSESVDADLLLRESIEQGKKNYLITESIWLPPVVTKENDVYCFEVPQSIPNFVTQNSVTGAVVKVEQGAQNLDGKIVLIESADPGFDWIFSHNVLGLITCYGGANSHMAVRAYELNIPSAIGVGNQTFTKLIQADSLFLDCSSKRIEVLE